MVLSALAKAIVLKSIKDLSLEIALRVSETEIIFALSPLCDNNSLRNAITFHSGLINPVLATYEDIITHKTIEHRTFIRNR